jgi:Tfp pilus assembly major pilin PilA
MSPEHVAHPYPSEKEKARMVMETGIELKKLNNWFVNNRIRYWKPRMEALQKEQRHQPSHRNALLKETQTRSTTKAARAKADPSIGSVKPSSKDTNNTRVQAAKVCPEVKCTVQVTSKLDLPTPFLRLVHEVSDASIATNEGSISSSDEDQDSGLLGSHFSPPSLSTYDEPAEFSSPPRRVRKRPRGDDNNDAFSLPSASPRTKYSQKDIETWKTACETSPKLHDTSLPSLDEAACLFGYSIVSV